MENKNLYVYINSTGQKIKTSGMTINQNSTNNVLNLVTVGKYASITITFKNPDGHLSNKYHMIYSGKYELGEDDTQYPVLSENGDNLYLYTFEIPFSVTSVQLLGNSARLNVAFSCYEYDRNQYMVEATVANAQIVVNQSSSSDTLDESYNGVDVENIWVTLGNNTYAIEDIKTDISTNYVKNNKNKYKKVYGTTEAGVDNVYLLGDDGGQVPLRDSLGEIHVPTNPVDNVSAVNKEYVENTASTLNTKIDTKLTAVSEKSVVYGTNENSEQVRIPYIDDTIAHTIPIRSETGSINTGNAIKNSDAVNLGQMNTALDKKVNLSTSSNIVYGNNGDGKQTLYTLSGDGPANTVPIRISGGRIKAGNAVDDHDVVNLNILGFNLQKKLDTAGGVISGDLSINGKLYLNGSPIEITTEHLAVSDFLIEVGKGNTTALVAPAGLKCKYDGKSYSALVWDKSGIAYVGDVALDSKGNINVNSADTKLQPLATRDMASIGTSDSSLVVWDAAEQTLKNSGYNVAAIDNKLDKITSTDTSGLARLYVITADGGQTAAYTDTYDLSQYMIPMRAENGNLIVPETPRSDISATSKKYVDSGFVRKLQSHEDEYKVYANKPNGDDYYPVSNGAVRGTLAERLEGGRLAVGTPVDESDATNKQYVDNGFLKKQSPGRDAVYGVNHGGGVDYQEMIPLLTIPTAWCAVRYDGDKDVIVSDTPTSDNGATSKKYVDNKTSTNYMLYIRASDIDYQNFLISVPNSIDAFTQCFMPTGQIVNMQLTFAKGNPPTISVCRYSTLNGIKELTPDLQTSPEAVESYTGTGLAYYITA